MKSKMKSGFKGWTEVAKNLKQIAEDAKLDDWLNEGQRNSIQTIAKRIKDNGIIIADEVGMGKTRIAVALAKAVKEAHGRVAVLIPSGLGYQWQEEFRTGKIMNVPDPVRSLSGYFDREPHTGWYAESIVLVSHIFSNWQHKENSKTWRFALLPEMYAWLRKENRRIPKNYELYSADHSSDEIREMAKRIINAIPKDKNNPARKRLKGFDKLPWSKELFFGSSYQSSNGEGLREYLKTCVGLGLGIFDLIIIDEAHKNRGENSGLNKLLEKVICRSNEHRVIGLTATPVELKLDDWLGTLGRIGVKEEMESIEVVLKRYETIVRNIRVSWKFSEEDRNLFKKISAEFERKLKKYIIRRDKRGDADILYFEHKTGLSLNQYRTQREVIIDPVKPEFPERWRKAVCAAEALSFSTKMKEDSTAKRLRLTFASGHSINALLDNFKNDGGVNHHEERIENFDEVENESLSFNQVQLQKRKGRVDFWKRIMDRTINQNSKTLFYHPSILATVKCIENDYTNKHLKVLVFGKFTQPMEALVSLLNAREMIRRIDAGKFWPQYTLRNKEEKIVSIALDQIGSELKKKWELAEVKKVLAKNEKVAENARRRFRNNFIKNLKLGYLSNEDKKSAIPFQLLVKLEEDLRTKKNTEIFNQITHACYELLYGAELVVNQPINSNMLCEKFHDLILATSDRDVEDNGNQQAIEEIDKMEMLKEINERLKEEFGSQSGRFARFMYGATKQHTRRLMQLSFNREGSFPFVLVAQSKVGREGLNLHKACKTVMMLHPEWNPGVAEQQIGRVDRLGSFWSEKLREYTENSESIPRIEIRPVIFKHGYDEQNWNVLTNRWDDLRAQLHGIIIPDREFETASAEDKILIMELNESAPKFYPW